MRLREPICQAESRFVTASSLLNESAIDDLIVIGRRNDHLT
jgi:hypothetical protein